jgi:hypothetical protein
MWAEMLKTGGGPESCEFSSFLNILYTLNIQLSSPLNICLYILSIQNFSVSFFVFSTLSFSA